MQLLKFAIPIFTSIFGLLIPVHALNSKTILGKTFFTDEQRIKVKYYNNFLFSLIMAFAIEYFYLLIKINMRDNHQIGSQDLQSALVWGTLLFIFFLMMTPTLLTWINNFCIKRHIKYKIVLEGIGPVFIIRMHDKDTCICSKDANAIFSQEGTFILVPMEEIMKNELIPKKITKPNRSFWCKLFDLE